MSVFQGDFLGFQLGDEHSYRINITRVSTNDRYQDVLLPEFSDVVTQVPGGDGTYYWDTNYKQKVFTIDFAFDSLYDEDLRKLRQMFGYKGIKPLIFDEMPYKKYMVKCAQPPQLKYICFDELDYRIYKGEGSVRLVAYFPFGLSVVDSNIVYSNNGGTINNNGDLSAHLNIIYNLNNLNSITLYLKENKTVEDNIGFLTLSGIRKINENDKYIQINTQTQLIEGLDKDKKKTGHLYNKYITAGDFFQPPLGRSYLFSNKQYESAKYTLMFY